MTVDLWKGKEKLNCPIIKKEYFLANGYTLEKPKKKTRQKKQAYLLSKDNDQSSD